ncbi:MAG TPA: hypothetical protein VMY88_04690 [Acidimicrobiales bacterium]|nr:hypothetical protein [Acidimicrobiales bacterium]
MAHIKVLPETFHYVSFDAARIAEIASLVADSIGFAPDDEITIEVDERTPFGRSRVLSFTPLHIQFESGAFENSKKPRHLAEKGTTESLGVVLHRALDRRSPEFADAPPDEDLTVAQRVAWDAWAAGRCARKGWEISKPRRHYHFRARHGFSDAADASFEKIWTADSLSWAELSSLSGELASRQIMGG